jgi:glutamate N-acetyltransferase/amino-acid N-acetyltransferase
LQAYRARPGAKLLLTGGYGRFNQTTQPHAHYLTRYMLEHGVPEDDLLELAVSANTVEDALLTRDILAHYPVTSIIVVTSEHHAPRAHLIFTHFFDSAMLTFVSAPPMASPERLTQLRLHEAQAMAQIRQQGGVIVNGNLIPTNSMNKPNRRGRTMQSSTFVVPGFDAAGIAANIKKSGALDLALIASRVPGRAAAVFTRNAFPAAPVEYDRRLLAFNPEGIHGVIINSGGANACTGAQGDANARLTAEAVEKELGANDHAIFVMSTGVIGVQLPMGKLLAAIPRAVAQLRPDGWEDAARAIMTTDTRPKLFTRTVQLGDHEARLTGVAKGAGMIHPDMATMLSAIVTDVHITQPLLQQALHQAVNRSFNRISVDGDTSTNDTLLLVANGLAGNPEIVNAHSAEYAAFLAGLTAICADLAQAVVRDGEGVTKFVTIRVNGAVSDEEAHRAANTIATSPLVKTAFYGSDANWGRLLMAVGRSGIRVEPDKCDLFVGGGPNPGERMSELQLVAAGTPLPYAEADAAARFGQPEIDVRVELGLGVGNAIVWTCDLSHDYVSINGDYRS